MMLNGDDCHILDIGTEIFVWIGRGCTDQERESAMDQAQAFLTKSGRPEWIPITRFLQGTTPNPLTNLFGWVQKMYWPIFVSIDNEGILLEVPPTPSLHLLDRD